MRYERTEHLDALEDALGEVVKVGREARYPQLSLAEKVHHEHIRGLVVQVVGECLQRPCGGPPGVDEGDELRDLRADRFGAAAQPGGDGALEARPDRARAV